MRRLPVFFVLDCSESMVGDKIKKMEDALQMIVRNLRCDPHALETVYISVIAFAGIARTIVPLVDLISFYSPKLPIGGGTSLGEALYALMTEIDKAVVKTTSERKGDWKPIVYLFTDGTPTDEPRSAIEQWNAKYARKATVIAVGLGKSSDFSVLRQLTENVILFEESSEGDFVKFVKWVTDSVLSHSRSVGEGAELQPIPKFDESVMKLIKEPPSTRVDENCVVLVGRCQKTRKPYLMTYGRVTSDLTGTELKLQLTHYEIAGCYPLEEDYFAWSGNQPVNTKINTSELVGAPGCPHCGGSTAFAMCACGKLLCINGPGEAMCPWCEKKGVFEQGQSEFDVGRGRG